MARIVSPSEYKRMIDQYNREVKKHNDQVKRNIDQYNRDVKRHNEQVKKNHEQTKREIDTYNRQVRQFNDEQRRKKQELNSAIQQYNRTKTITTYTRNVVLTRSVDLLENSYQQLNNYNNGNISEKNSSLLIDYPTQETTNSIQLHNSLSGSPGEYLDPSSLQMSAVEQNLYNVSTELGRRWQGALYSLNPQNPDAARHFCTSVREIIIQLLDYYAPDSQVLANFPNSELHENRPNRRAKIKYLLYQKSIVASPMENFVNADVDDILTLFRTLNDGTHGSAGAFNVQQLLKVKKRVEDTINFISVLGPSEAA